MSRRDLLLALRRRTRVQTTHSVGDLGGGLVRLTCCSCGHVRDVSAAVGVGAEGARLLARWWCRSGKVADRCPVCERKVRDARYPLN